MRGDRRAAGFTLVEVLVALAIVGLALGAVAAAFGNALTAHETAAGAETALALAEEQLALAAAAPRPGGASGTYARYAWRTTVTKYDDGDKAAELTRSLPVLYRVEATVVWRDGRRSRQVALSTLRLAPATP
ncbi:MAG TPA: prepilin-type N-terminal cleavage/methylation domain-containing protein [Stellaceae bacterium]|nr:prepilin-type N-terminal cleavage/methylation domain-containing protein [Stellaceae bacterium]